MVEAKETAIESGDEWEKSEKERVKDLEERDAFSARLKEKDNEKQRSVVERSEKKVQYMIRKLRPHENFICLCTNHP